MSSPATDGHRVLEQIPQPPGRHLVSRGQSPRNPRKLLRHAHYCCWIHTGSDQQGGGLLHALSVAFAASYRYGVGTSIVATGAFAFYDPGRHISDPDLHCGVATQPRSQL